MTESEAIKEFHQNIDNAKNKFKEMGEATIRLQKERLENAENVLRIINESEEN